MQRRSLLLAVAVAAPGLALAQPVPGPRHDEVLGRDFDQLPPGARERVQNAFREGSPGLDDGALRQRWNAMTPQQRGETLTARERVQSQQRQQQRGLGGGQGARPMPQPGQGQGAPRGGRGGGQGGAPR